MNITDVKINKTFTDKGNLKGYASVTIGDFKVTGLQIMDGKNGLFVNMPQRKAGENEYKDVCYPTTKEAHEQLQTAVLESYQQKLEESHEQEQGQKDGGSGGQDKVSESSGDPAPEEDPEFTPEEAEGMSMTM